MKKAILSLSLLVGLQAYAEEYAYLTFETTDGGKSSVRAEGLSLSLSATSPSGTILTAGNQTFEVSNLSKMYFSNQDESTGIGQVTADEMLDITDIYDLHGRRLAKEEMKKGIYLVKRNQANYKIVIR